VDRRAAVPAPESAAEEAAERRRFLRRRSDARTVEETIRNAPADAIVKTFTLGGSGARRSALYRCGCVAVDPGMADANLQLLECPTHAALQAKLRRRRTDHHH
jgi:hypothetical protein